MTAGRGPEATPRPGGPRRRRAWLWRVLAGCVVLAVLAGGAFWWSHRDAVPPPGQATPAPSPSRPGGSPSRATSTTPPADAAAARPAPLPQVQPVTCPEPTVRVATAVQLRAALATAQPGTVIAMADGAYAGMFTGAVRGSGDAPIWLCGGAGAVLDAGGITTGYGIHLNGADHWRLVGFTVRNAQKGVMVDASRQVTVQGLTVTEIGDEGIHLRRGTTDSIVAGNTITHTGKRKPKFGEGVYVGTAESNWCDISGCAPDRSDRNIVAGNRIRETTSENIDIKEGTVGGFVVGNDLGGEGMTAADANVNVKGNAWRLSDNRVESPPEDAFVTHEILPGWGTHNLFERNTVTAKAGDGYIVALRPALDNVVECSNRSPVGMEVSTSACR